MKTAKQTARASVVRGSVGMTLIEIMVVIAIIGIVASAVGYGVTGYFAKAKVSACRIALEGIGQHLTMYMTQDGEYPNSLSELTKKINGGKAILKKSQLKDPWKKKLKYSASDDSFELCSNGPDKREGTEDDICLHDELE